MKNIQTAKNKEQLSQRNAFYGFIFCYILFLASSQILSRYFTLNNRLLTLGIIGISFIVSAVTLYTYGATRIRSLAATNSDDQNRCWGTLSIVIAAFSVASAVAGLAVGILISMAFKQFTYDPFTFSLWLSLAVAGWTYVYTELAHRIELNDLINLVGFYLIGGVTLSAVLNPNPKWWDESVSYLGMNKVPSSYIFNISIFISGLVLFAFSKFLSKGLDNLSQSQSIKNQFLTPLKIAFAIAPIGLMLVGVFHYGASPLASTMHNLSAYTAFGLYAAIMASLYFITKDFSRDFLRINYLLLLGLAGSSVLYAVGYLTLALNEIVAFGIISVWLVLFLRSTNLNHVDR